MRHAPAVFTQNDEGVAELLRTGTGAGTGPGTGEGHDRAVHEAAATCPVQAITGHSGHTGPAAGNRAVSA
ncbi:ferredoxin [Streptomyces sp. NPDC093085]|uniref:ferredoxin n=1 Tax=Streptomyces sp. NPDC093085 TaxID=3155068 RepID=UPI00341CD447